MDKGKEVRLSADDVWLLLAVRYALADRRFADFSSISTANNYLHDRPLAKVALEASLGRLQDADMLERSDEGYAFSARAELAWEDSGATRVCGASAQWHRLKSLLCEVQ
jgi:hypothetical protein